jgi:hypothetical protein
MTEQVISNNKIFAYCKPFSFAWSGNRFFIIRDDDKFTELGDGYMSEGKFGHHARIDHRILGDVEVTDTVFKFHDYDIEFDFSFLKNSKYLDKNKVSGKQKYDTVVIHHLKRFSKKRQ